MVGVSRRRFLQTAAAASLAAPTVTRASSLRQGSGISEAFDFVIAGAGHNSLITAAYLAKAGFSVLVLEGRPLIGGGCKTAEICLPGFKDDMCSSVHSLLMANPLIRDNELDLFDYGLEYLHPDPIMHMPFADGRSLTMWRDVERTASEYAKFSPRDAKTFLRLIDELKAYRQAAATGKTPLPGLWRRRHAMSGYDLVRETFESPYIRAFHLATGRFTSEPGGHPGTGRQAFSAIAFQIGGRPIPKGGSGMLVVALARVIARHGGVILTNKPVSALMIENDRCVGVECADASRYRARRGVVSTIHVKHLAAMAPAALWGDEYLRNLALFQPEEALFAFHYATLAPITYPLAEGGAIAPFESTILPYPERILRTSYDDARGIVNLDDMWLQTVTPSIADPTRAPAGHHTVKILGTVPYALREGPEHWDAIKQEVAARVLDYVRRFAPDFTPDKILAEFLMSPLDIERMNPAFWRGSIHGGGYGPAQMDDMRPAPGWADYRLPIPGLYQTGACTRPGGSITGKPGRGAAQAILADMGVPFEAVIKRG
ncbi:MAG: phytoene desaturase family protein [Pseudomonadota bacterium]